MLEELLPPPCPNSLLPVRFPTYGVFPFILEPWKHVQSSAPSLGEVGLLLPHFKAHSCLRLPALSVIRVKESS